jgi:hypothetical protein
MTEPKTDTLPVPGAMLMGKPDAFAATLHTLLDHT